MILNLTARNAVGASCAVGGRVTIPPHVWLGVSGESMRYARMPIDPHKEHCNAHKDEKHSQYRTDRDFGVHDA